MQTIDSLDDMFLLEIKDLYHAEKQLTRALPKAARKAKSSELRSAIEEHLQQTEGHVNLLEEVFKMLGQPPKAKVCEAMRGILKEAEEILSSKVTPPVKDAAIIGAAQKIEHYEIASYRTIMQWASQMGRDDIKQVLGQILDEEEETDRKLSELAKTSINSRALAEV
ncbi:ferritin-like domain-containing protein [Pedosphaera parvula]|uniref:Uncharacterized protein n=1 Tax=Pedosphaera parvula (strain Ellin514) TaxID=320771 RepID=B9X9P2_PEDPL|nr:ferritin-like domain-containing protein [Pedosphaera parvula]EEF63213.1 protein of unknown function DUF892 [Pedosphaera parvula Ellin514]